MAKLVVVIHDSRGLGKDIVKKIYSLGCLSLWKTLDALPLWLIEEAMVALMAGRESL